MSPNNQSTSEFNAMCAVIAEQMIITERAERAYRAAEKEYTHSQALLVQLHSGFDKLMEAEIEAVKHKLSQGQIEQPALIEHAIPLDEVVASFRTPPQPLT
jgi:hypothetical protein